MSGMELALEILLDTGEEMPSDLSALASTSNYSRCSDYWIGWSICFYQWKSGLSFAEIFQIVTYDDLQALYGTLHEADISKFTDVLEERKKELRKKTNLGRIRALFGCSQRQLADRSGVSLRSIQMYEQRQKDINRAQAETIYQLSRALGCRMEDLLER